ncbi:hypothetical protein ACVI3U_004471 [Sinorhizobium medicae]
MYVVLGANGRAGGETARALMELGIPVRVVLRRPEQAGKWTRLGTEFAIGSIEDVASLTAALRDASGAFLLSPPPASGDPYSRAHEVGIALAQAVREARLPKLVALSSIGAQHDKGTGVIATLNSLEKHLEGAARVNHLPAAGLFRRDLGRDSTGGDLRRCASDLSRALAEDPDGEHNRRRAHRRPAAYRGLQRQADHCTAGPAGLERQRCCGRIQQGARPECGDRIRSA